MIHAPSGLTAGLEQPPEPQVTARLERAHPQCLGDRHRLPVVALGALERAATLGAGHLALEEERPSEVATLVVFSGELRRVLARTPGRLRPARQQIDLRKPSQAKGLVRS